MPRRRRRRRVGSQPDFEYFRPGRGSKPNSEVFLMVEEFEAIRLNDLEGKSQKEAAKEMGISQPTFHRTLVSAREKIADALVNGKAIKIKGGNYEFVKDSESDAGNAKGRKPRG
ncbi:MAG: DUF134 domain-containing protein [Candidatus Hadarchaeia archaeon]